MKSKNYIKGYCKICGVEKNVFADGEKQGVCGNCYSITRRNRFKSGKTFKQVDKKIKEMKMSGWVKICSKETHTQEEMRKMLGYPPVSTRFIDKDEDEIEDILEKEKNKNKKEEV